MLVLGGEAAHGAEAGENQRMETGLAAAREDGVGVPPTDQLGRLADGGRPGRAGGDRRVVGPADAEVERDLPAGGVDEHARDEVRRHPVGAALAEDVVLLGDPDQAADRGSEQDPDPGRLVGAVEAGVCNRLPRRGDGQHDVAVEPARLLRPDDLPCVEAFHLRGDTNREAGRVERADEVDPAAAGDGALPGRAPVVSERADRPQPGHDDALHAQKNGYAMYLGPSPRPVPRSSEVGSWLKPSKQFEKASGRSRGWSSSIRSSRESAGVSRGSSPRCSNAGRTTEPSSTTRSTPMSIPSSSSASTSTRFRRWSSSKAGR